MKTIKVMFHEWNDPNTPDLKKDNIFTHVLRLKYNVDIVNHGRSPGDVPKGTIMFYPLGEPRNTHRNYKDVKKIYYSCEPGIWDKKRYATYYQPTSRDYICMQDSDYVISTYEIDDEKHFRLPFYMIYAYQMVMDGRIPSLDYFLNPKSFTKEDIANRKFCALLQRNSEPKRIEFRDLLNKYKKVDDVKIPGHSYEKCMFIKNYKFTFGFENNDGAFPWQIERGIRMGEKYTTEKIIEPMAMGSIPLYWGNKDIGLELNSKSFVNWYDYGSDEKMIEKIIELDNDDDKYLEMLNQPNVTDIENSCFNFEPMIAFFEKIIN